MLVRVLRLDKSLPVPCYACEGDAGADLVTAVDVIIEPLTRVVVPTGIAIEVPSGYAAFVHPRSGLAAKTGLSIVNTPGTIDPGYRGEVQVCLINTDVDTPITLRRGDRIAQLVIQPVVRAEFVEVDELSDSQRATGGYGSTGGWETSPGQR